MQLIASWRRAARLWSVRVPAIAAALFTLLLAAPDQLLAIWAVLPAEVQALVPGAPKLGLIFSLASILARLVAQKGVADGDAADEAPLSWIRSLISSRKGAAKKGFGLSAAVLAILASTIAVEGGYVNDPRDPGGETNKGVTKRVAVAHGYTGPMRKLPDDVVHSIYYDTYLVAPGYEPLIAIDAPVAQELFDTTVNMGPARPGRFFQLSINELCGVQLGVDGRVGPATIAAYAACQRRLGAAPLCVSMLTSLDAKQRAEYDRLVRVNPVLVRFHKGWVAHRIGNVDRTKCRVSTPATAPVIAVEPSRA
jgi:lysozyme family protein